MRIFLTFIFCLTTLASQANSFNKGINVNGQFYPYEMIDSITYSQLNNTFTQDLWFDGVKLSTILADENKINHYTASESGGLYEIEINNTDIEKALVSRNGLIVLWYKDKEENQTVCFYLRSKKNYKIFVNFNSDKSISNIVSENHVTYFPESDSEFYSIVTFDKNGTFSQDTIPSKSMRNLVRSADAGIDSFIDNISRIYNINDYLQTIRSDEQSIWERLGDLSTFMLGEMLPTLGGGFYGKLVDLSLGQLNNLRDKYHNDMLNVLFGNCSIEIISINHTDYNYTAELKITGTESLPKNRYSNKPIGVYFGIVGQLSKTPTYQQNAFNIGPLLTYDNITQNVNLGQLNVASHYFVVPYLVSYNQVKYNHISDEIRYGNITDFYTPVPNSYAERILENSITSNSASLICTFNNICESISCGVEIKDEDNKVLNFNASNINGEQTVQLSGLKSSTQYTCRTYTIYNGTKHYSTNPVIFTTDPSFEDTYIRWWYDVPGRYGYEWGLELFKDGTASQVNHGQGQYYYYYSGTWSGGENSITVTIEDRGWLGDTKIVYTGSVDNPKNPTKLTGTKTTYYKYGGTSSESFTLYPWP